MSVAIIEEMATRPRYSCVTVLALGRPIDFFRSKLTPNLTPIIFSTPSVGVAANLHGKVQIQVPCSSGVRLFTLQAPSRHGSSGLHLEPHQIHASFGLQLRSVLQYVRRLLAWHKPQRLIMFQNVEVCARQCWSFMKLLDANISILRNTVRPSILRFIIPTTS